MARKSRKYHSVNEEFSQKTWKTAIYARLSREDSNDNNETIEAQIEEVKEYLKIRTAFNLIDVYSDDGFTGTNFKRPQFERLMEDIRNHCIDCIIVKDLSRFAREHIDAEDYLNNIFPFLGIRFIAIRDNYDNIDIEPQEYFIASFKNFANAHFAKETSQKVIQTKRRLQEEGKFIGSKPPYGYKRDPTDKHKLIIDEEVAPIIREVFQRSAKGEKHSAICRDLNNRGILTVTNKEWTHVNLNRILSSDVYIGTLTQRRHMQALYKNELPHKVPIEEQIRTENAFPSIIERSILLVQFRWQVTIRVQTNLS